MQIGTVFVKVVARPLQKSSRSVQFIVLAGFDPRLTHTTATYVQTLPPVGVLTEDDVVEAIENARVSSSATSIKDLTNEVVSKKLEKLFESDAALM